MAEFFSGLSFPAVGFASNEHHRRHRPLYYGIQFNESGRFQLRIGDGKPWELSGAWAFITHPGAEFEYRLDPGDRHFYAYACFIGPRIRDYLSGGLLDLAPRPIRIGDPERFIRALAMLRQYREEHDAARCIWQLEDLLLQLKEESRRGEEPGGTAELAELRARIERHPEHDWDFPAEAARLGVTIQHFRRRFLALAGTSPQQFLIARRLERGATLLRESDLPQKEIARRCGIDDRYYFAALFKKHYQQPPGAYRREFNSGRLS